MRSIYEDDYRAFSYQIPPLLQVWIKSFFLVQIKRIIYIELIYWTSQLFIYCVYKANILKLFRNRIVLLEHIDFKSQPPNYSYRRHDAWFSKVSHRTSRHLQASRAVARQRCLEATTCHRRRRDRRNLVEKLVEMFLEIVKIFQTFQNFYEIVWNCLKLFATFRKFWNLPKKTGANQAAPERETATISGTTIVANREERTQQEKPVDRQDVGYSSAE